MVTLSSRPQRVRTSCLTTELGQRAGSLLRGVSPRKLADSMRKHPSPSILIVRRHQRALQATRHLFFFFDKLRVARCGRCDPEKPSKKGLSSIIESLRGRVPATRQEHVCAVQRGKAPGEVVPEVDRTEIAVAPARRRSWLDGPLAAPTNLHHLLDGS